MRAAIGRLLLWFIEGERARQRADLARRAEWQRWMIEAAVRPKSNVS